MLAARMLQNAGVDPSQIITIGESFGTYVNHYIAESFGARVIDKSIALNPASEAGFSDYNTAIAAANGFLDKRGLIPLASLDSISFRGDARNGTIALHAATQADSQNRLAERDFLLNSHENDDAVNRHISGMKWLQKCIEESGDCFLLSKRASELPRDEGGCFDGSFRSPGNDCSASDSGPCAPIKEIPFDPWLLNPIAGDDSDALTAIDPNDITGPDGVGIEEFLKPGPLMPYTIRFENLETATAPAQEVSVTHLLDADLDIETFELDTIGWGSVLVEVPPGLQEFQARITTTNLDGSPLQVNVHVSLDPQTRIVTWTFRSVDSLTGTFPEDPLAGFLPPNNETGRGEGFVTYTIRSNQNPPTGTTIDQQASIVFDVNEPIVTNIFTNTIDAGVPSSKVVELPMTTPNASFTVTWSGTDDIGGSGIRSYDIYVSDNGGPFAIWQNDTTALSATFTGEFGHTYAFYSLAIDQVGYKEEPPLLADTQTTIQVAPRWQNPANPLDVNADNSVSPIDVLQIINELNEPRVGGSTLPTSGAISPPPFLDVNGDGSVSPIDALIIINFLNTPSVAEGEPDSGPLIIMVSTEQRMQTAPGSRLVQPVQIVVSMARSANDDNLSNSKGASGRSRSRVNLSQTRSELAKRQRTHSDRTWSELVDEFFHQFKTESILTRKSKGSGLFVECK